jgi:carbon-monoxide dehydrogenase iron sulfur subunit
MHKNTKVLKIDYEKCTGCRTCEQVCVLKHDGVINPMRSRIRVVKWDMEGLYIPMSCQQCQDAPCMVGCPVGAISRNDEMNRVEVDYDICIGCRTCVSVCPFGAMNFNPIDRKVTKCDLCDGDPQCVRFCDVKAIQFVESADVSLSKKRTAAKRLKAAQKQALALHEAM